MIRLTLVIPIYNAELYLRDCLDCIYASNIEENNFQVICVNDCSTDNSRDIVLEYQMKHQNLQLIDHVENRRAGGARNTGICSAKGEWVWFVDADDTIEHMALKEILYYCQKENLDALCFNYKLMYENKTVEKHVFNVSSDVQSGVDFLCTNFGENLIYHLGFPWRTIFRRSILLEHRVCFPEQLLYGEDTTFMVEGLMYAKRVKAINSVLYNYRQDVTTSSSTQLVDMRGERIYESIFCAGDLIVNLKDRAKNLSLELSESLEKGLPWFVNRLFMRLVKTSTEERREFYNRLDNKECLLIYMNIQNRLLVRYPLIGKNLLRLLSIIYKIKHK